MKKIFFFVLFISDMCIVTACAFHFVPFGADWVPASFYTNQFLQEGKSIGIMNYQRNFNRQFVMELANGVTAPFILRENISIKSIFGRIYSSHRMQCNLSLSSTDIKFDAASETGVVRLHSWSWNEIIFAGNYLLFEKRKNKNHSYFFLDYGLQTALISEHGIDNTVGWLKYEIEKITPRLLPDNYKTNLSLGISTLVDFKRIQVYSSGGVSNYFQNKNGFVYGKTFNVSSTFIYKAAVKDNIKLLLQEGFYFEHGSQDEFYESGKRILVAPCGVAQGSDLFLSNGINFQYDHISFFIEYYHPLWQNGFSEHQLFNQSIFLSGMAYSF